MAPRRHLSDRTLRALAPAKAGTRYELRDSIVAGFGVRVNDERDPGRPGKAGHVSFILYTRFPGSKAPTRRALGRYGELTLEQARAKAAQWRSLISRGVDPAVEEERARLAERRKRANTFGAIAEDFLRDKVSGERKRRAVELELRREFIGAWGPRPISEITPHDVRAIVKAAVDRGAPYQAFNLLALAKRLFNWVIDQHVYGLETSPCDRLKPKAIIGKRLARKRVFTNGEWRAFWNAAAALSYPYGPLFRMLALTGQRRSEVAEAKWREVDLDEAKLWTIPAERMKADAPHLVPLSAPVIALLKGLPRSGEYLFSTYGRKPVNGFSKAKQQLDERMAADLGDLPPFVTHDVRRSVRTGLSALPVSDVVRELVIAHTRARTSPGLRSVRLSRGEAAVSRIVGCSAAKHRRAARQRYRDNQNREVSRCPMNGSRISWPSR